MDEGVRALRDEVWTTVLPRLTGDDNLTGFDLVFCTDADSTVHKGALVTLTNACLADPNAIAACGFVFVEYEPGLGMVVLESVSIVPVLVWSDRASRCRSLCWQGYLLAWLHHHGRRKKEDGGCNRKVRRAGY